MSILVPPVCPARRNGPARGICFIIFCAALESLAGSDRTSVMRAVDGLGVIAEIMKAVFNRSSETIAAPSPSVFHLCPSVAKKLPLGVFVPLW